MEETPRSKKSKTKRRSTADEAPTSEPAMTTSSHTAADTGNEDQQVPPTATPTAEKPLKQLEKVKATSATKPTAITSPAPQPKGKRSKRDPKGAKDDKAKTKPAQQNTWATESGNNGVSAFTSDTSLDDTSKVPSRKDADEDVILIPDLDEGEDEDEALRMTVAAPPNLKLNRFKTIMELESSLQDGPGNLAFSSSNEFLNAKGIDLTPLTQQLYTLDQVDAEFHRDELTKAWDWKRLLTDVAPLIHATTRRQGDRGGVEDEAAEVLNRAAVQATPTVSKGKGGEGRGTSNTRHASKARQVAVVVPPDAMPPRDRSQKPRSGGVQRKKSVSDGADVKNVSRAKATAA